MIISITFDSLFSKYVSIKATHLCASLIPSPLSCFFFFVMKVLEIVFDKINVKIY